MSVAVVIANLNNGGQYLTDAMSSAVLQTVPPDEVIVVDGESTDDSSYIFQEFHKGRPNVCKWISSPPRGQADARNVGIAATDCEFIAPLDADDWIDRTFIERTLEAMKPGVGVVATGLVWPDGRVQWPVEPMDWESFLTGNRLFCCSLLRKSCWKLAGGYDTTRDLYEDWLLWGTIAARGWDIAVVREPLFHYRPHPGSSTDLMQHLDAEYRRKTIEQLKVARPGWYV